MSKETKYVKGYNGPGMCKFCDYSDMKSFTGWRYCTYYMEFCRYVVRHCKGIKWPFRATN